MSIPADNRQRASQYASEMLERFDAFVASAIAEWPHADTPLSPADFSPARYEILSLINQHRHPDGQAAVASSSGPGAADPADQDQYLPVTPAPWP